MSVFGKLGELVGWLLGEDLSAPAAPPQQQRAPAPPKPVQRRSEGDGFDEVRRAPQVTSPPRVEPSPPPTEDSTAEALAFAASLDDLHELEGGAVEPEPEFVPEGGMSTQSLMREFELLDPELQVAASELAARAASPSESAETSTQALLSEVDAVSAPASEVLVPGAQASVVEASVVEASVVEASVVEASGSPAQSVTASEAPAAEGDEPHDAQRR